jgi:hypothetical protein
MHKRLQPFLEGVDHGALATARRFFHELQAQSRLTYTGGSANDADRAALQPAVQEFVEFRHARGQSISHEILTVGFGEQLREDLDVVRRQYHGVLTAAEVRASQLGDAEHATLCGDVQMNDAIRHELQVVVGSLGAAFGGEEHRSALFDQKAQEGERLSAEL